MAIFLDLFGFIAVVLRAAALALGSVAIGGVVFAHLVNDREPLTLAGRHLLIFSSLGLAVIECLCLATNTAMLGATAGLTLLQVAGANFFGCSCVSLFAAISLCVLAVRHRETSWTALSCALLLLLSETATSHAAARVDHRLPLLVFTAVHQGATAAWIGGLPYLLLRLRTEAREKGLFPIAQRFSRLSVWSVGLLFAAGTGLACYYIGSPAAIYGTNYGLMVCAKVLLFLFVLGLGAVNFLVLRDLKAGTRIWIDRVGVVAEAEIGIGITVVLAAASLTSQPPGVDLTADRVSMPAIVARMSPELPALRTPPLSSLSPSTREAWKRAHPGTTAGNQAYIPGQSFNPSTPGDIAWSEYNHHWAGLVVLLAGVLAVFSRFRRFSWTKHWPLVFSGLAVFLLLRADPETWPLGPDGFWESFTSSDVAQHRIFVVLILLFAAFEWGVQTGRLRSKAAALVFPGVCAAGGALLLTHTHALTNVQEELLAELSHLPLALLAVTAGWARWLELRLPDSRARLAAYIWPVCFALMGVVLLLYREA